VRKAETVLLSRSCDENQMRHPQFDTAGRPMSQMQPRRHRTIFISDVHLGTKGCQADLLLDFLRDNEADTIYLVGDIIDGWRLRASWYWPQSHNDVVQKLLRKARKGTRIIYVPGNHDEFLRDYVGSNFGGIEIVEETIHETAAGRRILIIHGDKFDVVIRHVRWLAFLGDWAYDLAIFINGYVGRIRRWLGLPYWSFSAWSKQKVKSAVNFIGAFQEAVAADAERNGVDAVICGHIHQPAHEQIGRVLYMNSGDWVESCTAIVENDDGVLELVHFADAERIQEKVLQRAGLRAAA
jgi:UDP-2,3-diacylglucosamine pyrophosphatase LpxH